MATQPSMHSDLTCQSQGGTGQHHVRAIFADSAILCIIIYIFAIHLVLPVVCDRESFLVVCECRDSDQS